MTHHASRVTLHTPTHTNIPNKMDKKFTRSAHNGTINLKDWDKKKLTKWGLESYTFFSIHEKRVSRGVWRYIWCMMLHDRSKLLLWIVSSLWQNHPVTHSLTKNGENVPKKERKEGRQERTQNLYRLRTRMKKSVVGLGFSIRVPTSPLSCLIQLQKN